MFLYNYSANLNFTLLRSVYYSRRVRYVTLFYRYVADITIHYQLNACQKHRFQFVGHRRRLKYIDSLSTYFHCIIWPRRHRRIDRVYDVYMGVYDDVVLGKCYSKNETGQQKLKFDNTNNNNNNNIIISVYPQAYFADLPITFYV